MALHPAILQLVLVLALVAYAAASGSPQWTLGGRLLAEDSRLGNISSHTSNGLISECIDQDDMEIESGINRRSLRGSQRFISYGALAQDRTPCNRRGQSYYNCGNFKQVNPYRRGCNVITRCARYLY